MTDGFTLAPHGGGRLPFILSHPWPRMEASARERVEAALRDGCTCEGTTARLTRRKQINQVVTVHLQCETCGRSMAGSLPRAAHYFWQSYVLWDDALKEGYWARRAAKARATWDARVEAGATEWQQRRAEYADWCRESPVWHALADHVRKRAGFVCEACLTARATVVHHLTYKFGVLPPAWELRAVCMSCHDRLHADRHGREDDWCPQGYRS